MLIALAVLLLALAVAGRAVARRLFPDVVPTVRALVAVVVGLTLLTVPAEVLGSFGAFRFWPLLVTEVGLALLVTLWAGQTAALPPMPSPMPSPTAGGGLVRRRLDLVEAGALVPTALAAAGFAVRTVFAFRNGTQGFDSVNYHLPFAADFYVSGRTLPIPHLIYALPNDFFPATSELVHAVGMVLTRRDILSPLVSLLWLAVTWLAAAAAYDDRRRRLVAVAAVSVILLTPGVFFSVSATALADLASAGLALAAVVLWRRLPAEPAGMVVTGLAAGLAIGSKLSALAPMVLLAVAIVVAARGTGVGRRLGALLGFIGGAVVAGGFWFARDWVELGNPVPELDLHVFPADPHLYDMPLVGSPAGTTIYEPRSILYYLAHGSHLHEVATGIGYCFGFAWPAFVAALVVVCVVAFRRTGRGGRLLAGVALLNAAAYLVTPESAPSALGAPNLIAVSAEGKILLPAFFVGSVLLAGLAAPRRRGTQALLGGLLAAAGIAATVSLAAEPAGLWPAWPYGPAGYVLAAALYMVLALALWLPGGGWRRVAGWGWTGPTGWLAIGAAAVLLGGLLLGGVGGWTSYRYAGQDLAAAPQVRQALAGRPVRVAVPDSVPSYPLRGITLRTPVTVVGGRGPHGQFDTPTSCRQWLGLLASGGYDVVVTPRRPTKIWPAFARWTAADPGARRVLVTPRNAVFVLTRPPPAASCG